MEKQLEDIRNLLNGIKVPGYVQPELSAGDLKAAYKAIQDVKDTYPKSASADNGSDRSYNVCDGHITYAFPTNPETSLGDLYNSLEIVKNNLTFCSCNSNQNTPAWCSSRTTCSCNCRTSCDCDSRTQCSCNCRSGCDCDSRTTCSCNGRFILCDCHSRTGCTCNNRCGPSLKTGCTCNNRCGPSCHSRTRCSCNSRCECNVNYTYSDS